MASRSPIRWFLGKVFLDVAQRLFSNPAKMRQAQTSLSEEFARLWQAMEAARQGEHYAPVIEPEKHDRRFKDDEWTNNPAFDAIKQYYLLTARWIESLVQDVDGIDPHTRQKVQFYTRQFISADGPDKLHGH